MELIDAGGSLYAEGSIVGNIGANGDIDYVDARVGSIQGNVSAMGAIYQVTANGDIQGDVTAQGDIGRVQSWTGSINGKVTSSMGNIYQVVAPFGLVLQEITSTVGPSIKWSPGLTLPKK